MSEANLHERIQKKYGQAARQVAEGGTACCGGGAELDRSDPISVNLYDEQEKSGLPREVLAASLGCGNPSALARLKPGEVVLDLGSGGGIDVLLSARRVGPSGKAYGLEMTEEMLALARENQHKAQIANAEFLPGAIENIPLPNESVDVIISNCVINLSADKDRVLAEAFRVLKPGGRFAVSDVVVRGAVPAEVRRSMELWIGCVAGALEEEQYRQKLESAGFLAITVEPTRMYTVDEARPFLRAAGLDVDAVARQMEGKFMSAFVQALKPAQKAACCAPSCCTPA